MADGVDAGRHAVQDLTDFGIAECLGPLSNRDRLHAHHAHQERQAVGDTVVGFGNRAGFEGHWNMLTAGEGGIHAVILLSSSTLRRPKRPCKQIIHYFQ
jgi:hypothetical protein